MMGSSTNELTEVSRRVDEYCDRMIQIAFPKTWNIDVVKIAERSVPA